MGLWSRHTSIRNNQWRNSDIITNKAGRHVPLQHQLTPIYYVIRVTEKGLLTHVRKTKARIVLRFSTGWSGSSQFATMLYNNKSLQCQQRSPGQSAHLLISGHLRCSLVPLFTWLASYKGLNAVCPNSNHINKANPIKKSESKWFIKICLFVFIILPWVGVLLIPQKIKEIWYFRLSRPMRHRQGSKCTVRIIKQNRIE